VVSWVEEMRTRVGVTVTGTSSREIRRRVPRVHPVETDCMSKEDGTVKLEDRFASTSPFDQTDERQRRNSDRLDIDALNVGRGNDGAKELDDVFLASARRNVEQGEAAAGVLKRTVGLVLRTDVDILLGENVGVGLVASILVLEGTSDESTSVDPQPCEGFDGAPSFDIVGAFDEGKSRLGRGREENSDGVDAPVHHRVKQVALADGRRHSSDKDPVAGMV
jgi:hypothetical protein